MKIISGDLLELAKEGKFDVIIHGCNCFCNMGAGIAKVIQKEFPQAYQADCEVPGKREKLGTMTFAKVQISMEMFSDDNNNDDKTKEKTNDGNVSINNKNKNNDDDDDDDNDKKSPNTTERSHNNNCHELTIVNAYTQYHWRIKDPDDDCLLDYNALRSVFRAVKQEFGGLRIAYPKIGAGLAGGDWNRIAQIIDEELEGGNHTYVQFSRSSRSNNNSKSNSNSKHSSKNQRKMVVVVVVVSVKVRLPHFCPQIWYKHDSISKRRRKQEESR